jgi:hypothetical protein
VTDVVQALIGLLILVGFWWSVFAVIRMFEPSQPAPQGHRNGVKDALPPARSRPPVAHMQVPDPRRTPELPSARATPCCPDCTPGCQITGLAMGQAWGQGDDWWGQPFGDDGPNSEAMVFWGDGCCPDCSQCPICQGPGG